MIPQNVQNQADIAKKLMGGQVPVGTTVPGTGTLPVNQPIQGSQEPPQEDNWQHKYLVLQGKYNAEISRLNAAAGERDGVVAQQNRMISDLYQRLGEPAQERSGSVEPSTPATVPANTPRELRFEKLEEEDFSGYGDEIKGMAKNVNAMAATVETLTEEVKGLRGQSIKSAWDVFCEKMNTLLPGWEAINKDPAFMGWLEEKDHDRDPWNRHEALKHYAKSGDAQSAVKFFVDFNQNVRPKLTSENPTMSEAELVQPKISAATSQMPVGSPGGKSVTLDQYTKASQDYANKLITYDQWKAIADAFQIGLKASSTGR